MARQKEPFNPFYILLVIVGIAFVLTACCYGVMAFKQRDPYQLSADARSGQALIELVDEHGAKLLLVELLILTVATVGAISTDQYWSKRAAGRKDSANRENQQDVHQKAVPRKER